MICWMRMKLMGANAAARHGRHDGLPGCFKSFPYSLFFRVPSVSLTMISTPIIFCGEKRTRPSYFTKRRMERCGKCRPMERFSRSLILVAPFFDWESTSGYRMITGRIRMREINIISGPSSITINRKWSPIPPLICAVSRSVLSMVSFLIRPRRRKEKMSPF